MKKTHHIIEAGIFMLLIPFVCSCVVSCSPSEVRTETELAEFISDSPQCTQTVASKDIEITVQYRPTDLLIAQELRSFDAPTVDQIQIARKKFSQHYYFLVTFRYDGNELLNPSYFTGERYSEVSQILSFQMGEYVVLRTSEGEDIPVEQYVFDRTFGKGPGTSLLFVFGKPVNETSTWVELQIDEFGLGMGKQSIRFQLDALKNTPTIYNL